MKKSHTIFCDIDGTLFEYRKFESYETSKVKVLEGVKEKLDQWMASGHMIILTTARPEYLRNHTEKELKESELVYDELIMGIERGPRVLINDCDPQKAGKRAIGVNLERNQGFSLENWENFGL